MPVDFTSNPGDDPTMNESDTPMFAPIPTWERNRKRRGFGGRSSAASTPPAEPRSFIEGREDRATMAPMAAGAGLGASASAAEMDATDAPFATRPLNTDRRTTTVRRKGNGAPMAIAAGLIVLAGVAAAGWYASRPHDGGVAQLTPGVAGAPADASAPVTGPTMAQSGATSAAPTPSAADTRAASSRTVVASSHTASARHATAVVRARPSSASAADVGVNASATLPAAPVPYSARTPAPAPTAAPPVNPAPTQAAPAPSAAPAPTAGPTDTAPSASPPTTSAPPTATTPTPTPTETPPQ